MEILVIFQIQTESIVEASCFPMSIIIIGVGNNKFKEMRKLDGKNTNFLKSGDKVAERDIVHFVEMRRFFVNDEWNKEDLTQLVLAELPSQVVSYMRKMGHIPQ